MKYVLEETEPPVDVKALWDCLAASAPALEACINPRLATRDQHFVIGPGRTSVTIEDPPSYGGDDKRRRR